MDRLHNYWYSRFVFERFVAALFLIAFVCAANQFVPLLGERGLLPVTRFVSVVPFGASPSLFYFHPTDAAFRAAAWLGVVVSCVAMIGVAGGHAITAGAVWALIWMLYLSFVNVGQTFYAFGWESLLLEMGFFLIFAGARSNRAQHRAQLDLALGAVSVDVRRRSHQAARRSLLARFDLSRLLLRDAANS